jgi:hypothetical protein
MVVFIKLWILNSTKNAIQYPFYLRVYNYDEIVSRYLYLFYARYKTTKKKKLHP